MPYTSMIVIFGSLPGATSTTRARRSRSIPGTVERGERDLVSTSVFRNSFRPRNGNSCAWGSGDAIEIVGGNLAAGNDENSSNNIRVRWRAVAPHIFLQSVSFYTDLLGELFTVDFVTSDVFSKFHNSKSIHIRYFSQPKCIRFRN